MESVYRCPSLEFLDFHPHPLSSEEQQTGHIVSGASCVCVHVSRPAGIRRRSAVCVPCNSTKGKLLGCGGYLYGLWVLVTAAPPGSEGSLFKKQGHLISSVQGWGFNAGHLCWGEQGTPNTFVRFYRLDVSGLSLNQAVLEVNMPGSV